MTHCRIKNQKLLFKVGSVNYFFITIEMDSIPFYKIFANQTNSSFKA